MSSSLTVRHALILVCLAPFVALACSPQGDARQQSQQPPASQPSPQPQQATEPPRIEEEGAPAANNVSVTDTGEAVLATLGERRERAIGDRSIFITDGTIKITVLRGKITEVFQVTDHDLTFTSSGPGEVYDTVRVGNATYQNCLVAPPKEFPRRDCTAHIFDDDDATTPVLTVHKTPGGDRVVIHSDAGFATGWTKSDSVWQHDAGRIAKTRLVLGPPNAPAGTWARTHRGGANSTGVPDLGWRGILIRRGP